jgi:hypothetical protein
VGSHHDRRAGRDGGSSVGRRHVIPLLNRAKRPDAATATSLARHLDAFAATLPPRERAVLDTAVFASMVPLDRMKGMDPGEILSDEELALFGELLAVHDEGSDR